MYKPVVWLFSCDLRDISIRYLPAAHPIKRWISFHNHVTYAHSSGIRRRIYEKSALSIPCSPLMDYYFYTFANEERAYSRVRRMVFLHCLHWWIATSTLLQMEKWTCNCIRLIVFSSSPLTDCYFYTSANGERAGSRVWLMVSFPSLHWWIATSTLLQMENGQVAVYTLLFFFLVSFDGLLLLHICKWRMSM